MVKELKGRVPNIDGDTFIAETGSVIGQVTIGSGASVWYNAVLRGDINSIKIGKGSNIQDNVMVHVGKNYPTEIGDGVTIGHNAIIHGCKIGNNCLIGMGAIILNGAVIGDNSIIGAGALVTEGKIVEENSVLVGIPGKVIRRVSEEEVEMIRKNGSDYVDLWRKDYK